MWLNLNCCTLTIGAIVIFSSFERSSQYKRMYLEDDHLCSPISKRKSILNVGVHSGLIVNISSLSSHKLDWKHNYICKFKVLPAYDKGGVIAVIQRLKFRKEKDGYCKDFVQFYNDKGATSLQFCGDIDTNIEMDSDDMLGNRISSRNAFVTDGDMSVRLNISKDSLDINEQTDFLVIFTSFRDCGPKSNRKPEEGELKPCLSQNDNVCIDKQYFKDDFVNCPYYGCVDEALCLPSKHQKLQIGNNVLIGSISTLLVMFGLFILCLWAFRKHHLLCWSEEFAHPTPTTQSNRNSRVLEMNEQTGARLADSPGIRPNAPPEEDKDLPPSYDSLFPESTNSPSNRTETIPPVAAATPDAS